MTTVLRAAPRAQMIAVRVCSLLVALGAGAAATAAETPQPGLRLSAPGEAVKISVTAVGAVKRPGKVAVSPLAATVDGVISVAGGARTDAYRFAVMVLRADTGASAEAESSSARCVPLADLHAALLVRDDADLASDAALSRQLLGGQLRRAALQDVVLGLETASPAPDLLDGDMLVLPGRTGTVYVAADGSGRIARFQHEPTVRAEEYLRLADPEDAADVDRYVLLYPNGRAVDLRLAPWRYEPTMVPPGSLIAPAVDCLPGE
ncbi:MAG: hypothetical protein WC809_12415 [Sinimarinibacterium sp.]|jgi:protein involved in polysaccharide export with SLBB domain